MEQSHHAASNGAFGRRDDLSLDALLHPSRVYARPADVLQDDGLNLSEKRAILASWASDACAVEAAPELRCIDSGQIVRFDEVMDALRKLDAQAQATRKPRKTTSLDAYKASPWLAMCS